MGHCQTMSVEMEPTCTSVHHAHRPVDEIARTVKMDPRVEALVPGVEATLPEGQPFVPGDLDHR